MSSAAAAGTAGGRASSSGSTGDKDASKKDKKRRVTHSCNICRKKRIKCDGEEPLCGPCATRGWDCTWTAPKKRGPPPGKQVQAKMQKMETHLYELYSCVAGLQEISELLLGLRGLEDADVQAALMGVPGGPRARYGELQTLLENTTPEDRLTAFRDTPAGKLFVDEAAEQDIADFVGGGGGGGVHGGGRGDPEDFGNYATASSSNVAEGFASPASRKRARLNSPGASSQHTTARIAKDETSFYSNGMDPPPLPPLPSPTLSDKASLNFSPASAHVSSNGGALPPLPTPEQAFFNSMIMPAAGKFGSPNFGYPQPSPMPYGVNGTPFSSRDAMQASPPPLPAPAPTSALKLSPEKRFARFEAAIGSTKVYGPTSHFASPDQSSSRPTQPSLASSGPWAASLPSSATRARLIDCYLTVIHPVFPMCSRNQLMQWSYEPQPSFDAVERPEVLFAVLACAAPYLPPTSTSEPITDPSTNARQYAAAARSCVETSLRTPTAATVQASALLAIHEWGQGELTLAYVHLATAVALAIDLGLHLGPAQHQSQSTNDQSPPFERLRLTWYSLFILDTCLASQLGRMPLTPARHAVSLPAVTGGDEWELMRSESVPALEKLYAKPLTSSEAAPGPMDGASAREGKRQEQQQHSSFGQIGPSKALSTFNSAVSIARAAHRALSILNAPNESSNDVIVIAECKAALDSMEADFREFRDPAERETLSHTTQHKLDLYLRWLYYMQLLEERLSSNGLTHPTGTVERSLEGLDYKLRTFSYYRTAIPGTTTCFTLAGYARPGRPQSEAAETAHMQLACIFPTLLNRLEQLSLRTPASLAAHGHEVARRLSTATGSGLQPFAAALHTATPPVTSQNEDSERQAMRSLEFLLGAASSVFENGGGGSTSYGTSPHSLASNAYTEASLQSSGIAGMQHQQQSGTSPAGGLLMPTPPMRTAQLKEQQQQAHHLISEEQHLRQMQQQQHQAQLSHQRDQPMQQHTPEMQELVEQSRQLFQQASSGQPDTEEARPREEQQRQQEVQPPSLQQDHQTEEQSNWYSLPDQAFMTLAEDFLSSNGAYDATFEHGRIFDSASWAQTDVLASLGFLETPNPSQAPSPNEFSGLTGLLDRWNHGDGAA